MHKHPNFDYMPRSWQVHRFGDQVAGYLGDGATAYMTPSEARELAKALIAAADSCTSESVVRSTIGTATGTLSGKQP